MSAFVVSKATIDAIVGFAWGNGYSPRVDSVRDFPDQPTTYGFVSLRDLDRRTAPDKLGQLLWHENHVSVNYRYREDDQTPRYRFQRQHLFYVSEKQQRPLKPVDIIKLCDCLEYQSCEHPGWESSWAKDFLDRVRSAAVRAMPEYDSAPWGLYDGPAARATA